MGSRSAAAYFSAAVVVLASVGVGLLLDLYGKGSRRFAGIAAPVGSGRERISVVRGSRDLHALYRESGVHGRKLLHLGAFLHYVDVDPALVLPSGGGAFPVVADVLPAYEERLTYRTSLWVAMQAGLVREIQYVQPPAMLSQRLRELSDLDVDVVSIDGRTIVAHDWGARRTITDRFLPGLEPVILNIDASFLRDTTPSEVLSALRSSGLRADLVTLNLSEDNPDVSGDERASLLELARIWAVGSPR